MFKSGGHCKDGTHKRPCRHPWMREKAERETKPGRPGPRQQTSNTDPNQPRRSIKHTRRYSCGAQEAEDTPPPPPRSRSSQLSLTHAHNTPRCSSSFPPSLFSLSSLFSLFSLSLFFSFLRVPSLASVVLRRSRPRSPRPILSSRFVPSPGSRPPLPSLVRGLFPQGLGR